MFASSSLVQQNFPLALPSLMIGPNAFEQDSPMNTYPPSLLGRSQSEPNSRLLPDRISVPLGLTPFSLRPEMHHHQHLHQHMHQHLLPPAPGSASGADPTPSGPTIGSTGASSMLLGMAGYSGLVGVSSSLSSLPGFRPGPAPGLGPLGLPLTSGVSGAFHPKNDTCNVNSVSHLLLSDRLTAAQQTRSKKSGQWCSAHARIAWEIHIHQQHQKLIQNEVQRLCPNTKTADIDRLNDSLQNLPSGETTSMAGNLEFLYRLGVPLFGRLPSPFSSRSQLGTFPFGGLGSFVHRLAAPQETPGGGFGTTASDWLRLSKSSTFSLPPPVWLSSDREREKAEDRRSKQNNSQETTEVVRERISDSYRSSGSSGGGSSSNKNDRNRSRSPLKSHRSKDSSLRRNSHSPPPPPHRVPSDHRSSSSSTSNDARQRTERNGRTHSSHSTKSDSPLAAAAAAGRIESLSSTSLGLLFPGLYPTTAPRPADPQQNALASSEKFFLQHHHHPFPWSNPFQPDGGEQWRRLLLGASGGVDCDPTAATLNSDGLFADVSRLTPMDMMYRKAIAPPTALGGGGGGGLRFPFRHLSASPGFLENTGIYPPSSLRLPLSARFPLIDPSVSSMYKLIADGLHPELR